MATPTSPSPVAIITGASSGIGLALTLHLLSHPQKQWRVALLDINPPPSTTTLPEDRTLFIPCDVSIWENQASAFRKVHEKWGRVDFAALNAGIDDRDDIFRAAILDLEDEKKAQQQNGTGDDGVAVEVGPRKPNMLPLDVNFTAVYYGIKLFTHYHLRNPLKINQTGLITVTSSLAGLLPHPPIPQYTASKYALNGLVKSLAPSALKVAGIRINAICPAMVATGLAPKGLMGKVPVGRETPMGTILRAYDSFFEEGEGAANSDNKTESNKGEKGEGGEGGENNDITLFIPPTNNVRPKGGWNGQCVLANVRTLTFYGNEADAEGEEEGMGATDPIAMAFEKVYEMRNVDFARRGA